METLIEIPAWVAALCYAFAVWDLWRDLRAGRARWFWTAAWGLLVVHVILAMSLMYNWSWAAAWADTARRTQQQVQLEFGAGVIINVLTLVIWGADLWAWWRVPAEQHPWPGWVRVWWHLGLCFIMYNAVAMFADSPFRWVGLYGGGLLLVGISRERMQYPSPAQKREREREAARAIAQQSAQSPEPVDLV